MAADGPLGTAKPVGAGPTASLEQHVRELEAAVVSLTEQNHKLEGLAEIRSQLISNMMHDLSAPVVALRGYSKMLLEEQTGLLTTTQREYLGAVLSNIERIVALLNTMRRVVSQPSLQLATFDLHELWQDSVKLVQRDVVDNSIEMVSLFSEEPFRVVGDKENLALMLNGLVSNAVKFSRNGGRVEVDFTRQDEEVRVRMTYAGDSIPQELAEKILSGSTQSDAGAAGLSNAHDIVRLHGGRISLVSRPGAGNTVLVTLPDVILGGVRGGATANEQA